MTSPLTRHEGLSEKMLAVLRLLAVSQVTTYQVSSSLFGEAYGIYASRARSRLHVLKRAGLASNLHGRWSITDKGRAALKGGRDE